VFVRGGTANILESSGIYAIRLNYDILNANRGAGFRCAR